jgi:hypothetical protein
MLHPIRHRIADVTDMVAWIEFRRLSLNRWQTAAKQERTSEKSTQSVNHKIVSLNA